MNDNKVVQFRKPPRSPDPQRLRQIKALEELLDNLCKAGDDEIVSFSVFAMHPADSADAPPGEHAADSGTSFIYVGSEVSDPAFLSFVEAMVLRNRISTLNMFLSYGEDDE
jgi:hypothetical protein